MFVFYTNMTLDFERAPSRIVKRGGQHAPDHCPRIGEN